MFSCSLEKADGQRKTIGMKLQGAKEQKMGRKKGFYEKYIKRGFDIFCSGLAVICFGWLYLILAVLVKIKLGSPVLCRPNKFRPNLIYEIGRASCRERV